MLGRTLEDQHGGVYPYVRFCCGHEACVEGSNSRYESSTGEAARATMTVRHAVKCETFSTKHPVRGEQPHDV